MFDPESASSIQSAADLERLMDLIRLVTDPKSVQKRLDDLTAATVRATEERAAAERAKADLNERKVALDRYEARIDEKAVELYQQQCGMDEARGLLLAIRADIQTRGDQFKKEVLRYADLEIAEHHGGLTQDLPDWPALAVDVLGRLGKSDPQFGGDAAASFEAPEPAPNLVEGSSLTHAPAIATVRRSRPPRPTRADR